MLCDIRAEIIIHWGKIMRYIKIREETGGCLGLSVGFPRGSVVKNLPASTGDASSIPGSGRLPGRGNGNPLQYSCLENPLNRGARWVTIHGVAESQT